MSERALLIGKEPDLPYEFVEEAPYACVVLGSLSLRELLDVPEERVLEALAEDMPVYLYEPGLPQCRSRSMAGAVAAAKRRLKTWGVRPITGREGRLITAQEARRLRELGQTPPPGSRLTPLARDILEGTQ